MGKIRVFEFKTKNENCRFEVEGLKVSESEVEYDSIVLYINGNEYDEKRQFFNGSKMTNSIAFEIVVNAYLRGDKEFDFFGDSWMIFKKINKVNAGYEGRVQTLLPQIDFDSVVTYELQLETNDGFKFYSYDDYVMLVDENGSIKTDVDAFYESAMMDAIKDYILGKNVVYISPAVEEWIKEEGDDYFLGE